MSGSLLRPWQSIWLPRVVTIVVVIVGLPLFLRMPLWCDLTLYDIAAWNLLHGGIHYRDVFDTNLPGFIWVLTAIRWVCGFDPFWLRCVDLAIVIGVVLLVDWVAKRGGATPVMRWWAIAGAAVLYLGTPEMVHAQRDIWMALPVLTALVLRLQRTEPPASRPFARSMLEGVLWGVAVWIKPHCVLMAAGVWVVTTRRIALTGSRLWRIFAADLLGNIAGGLIVGLLGIAWLIGSGTWPYFWEVVTVWAPEYSARATVEFDDRLAQELHWFPPWSLALVITVPLAVLSILDAALWSNPDAADQPGPVGRLLPAWLWDGEVSSRARFARGTLAALYLVWAFQSFLIQRLFIYAHLTELFLMFGLWAAHRWAMPAIGILWIAITSAIWLIADADPAFRERLLSIASDKYASADAIVERYVVRHSLTDSARLRNWPDCWRFGLPAQEQYALWDRTALLHEHGAAIGWEELGEVAEFLRKQDVKDGELIAWHDTPHALYLMLAIKPGLRYFHLNTIKMIGEKSRERVQAELTATEGIARFAVSDLESYTLRVPPEVRRAYMGPPRDQDHLVPPGLPAEIQSGFPFNQPTVFRSRGGNGRYIVHRLVPPLKD